MYDDDEERHLHMFFCTIQNIYVPISKYIIFVIYIIYVQKYTIYVLTDKVIQTYATHK